MKFRERLLHVLATYAKDHTGQSDSDERMRFQVSDFVGILNENDRKIRRELKKLVDEGTVVKHTFLFYDNSPKTTYRLAPGKTFLNSFIEKKL